MEEEGEYEKWNLELVTSWVDKSRLTGQVSEGLRPTRFCWRLDVHVDLQRRGQGGRRTTILRNFTNQVGLQ